MKVFFLVLALAASALAQKKGTQTQETHLPMTVQTCSAPGSCTQESTTVVLDSNWRWTHDVNGYENCYDGNDWVDTYCPDSATCTQNCAIDGVDSATWSGNYGISTSGDEITFTFVTHHTYGINIGARTYLLDSSGSNYFMFYLLNKEFTFDIDDHELECGLNGALYLVEMDADGGFSKYPTNECGAEYGTGYCDAQCPHDMKWINGEANCDDWVPSDNDANSGKGHYGSCCMEFDIWEANKWAQAYTSHPCNLQQGGSYACEDLDCGDNPDHRYDGVCDKDGCDFASYRLGDHAFWGPGSNYTVDSSRPVTVVTQFITDDGTDNGNLAEIRRLYVQDGVVIDNSQVNIPGVTPYDSITDAFCTEVKAIFGDPNDHGVKGGLQNMGESLRRGHVLVMSMWDDHEANMLWLDSNYPVGSDPNEPGNLRGPCPETSGQPDDVEEQWADAHVRFSNIRTGPIGSTYSL